MERSMRCEAVWTGLSQLSGLAVVAVLSLVLVIPGAKGQCTGTDVETTTVSVCSLDADGNQICFPTLPTGTVESATAIIADMGSCTIDDTLVVEFLADAAVCLVVVTTCEAAADVAVDSDEAAGVAGSSLESGSLSR